METIEKIKKLLTLNPEELDEKDWKLLRKVEKSDLTSINYLYPQDRQRIDELFKKHFIDFDKAKKENKSLNDF